jgi:HSP20 family protein
MANFFEKLKKGMDVENMPVPEKEDLPEETTPIIEKTSVISPLEVIEVEKKVKKNKVRKKSKIKKSAAPINKPDEKEPQKKKLQIKEIKEEKEGILKKKPEKTWFEPEGQLVVDLYEANGEIIIQSAIAGINPENLDVSIDNDMVIIKGKRERFEEESNRNYFYQECHWGYFSREIILPNEIDAKRSEKRN